VGQDLNAALQPARALPTHARPPAPTRAPHTPQGIAPRALKLLPTMAPRDILHIAYAYGQYGRRLKTQAKRQQAQAQQEPEQQQEASVTAASLSGAGAEEAREALSAAAAAAMPLLPEFEPYQLSALLASLRGAGRVDVELLQAALPHSLKVARRFGSDLPLTFSGWKRSWLHLHQLAMGHLPAAQAHADADGSSEAGGLDDDGGSDSDASPGSGPACPSAAPVQVEVVMAAAAACEQLLQRAEHMLQTYAKSAQGQWGQARPLRQRLYVPVRRAIPVLRAVTLVAGPEAAAPLARALAHHLLRAQQLPRTGSLSTLRLTAESVTAAGLTEANLLQGQFWPTLCDALGAKLGEGDGFNLQALAHALSLLQPPPLPLIGRVAAAMAPLVQEYTPQQLQRVTDACARALAFSAGGGSSGGGSDGGNGDKAPAPEHWAWDGRVPGSSLPLVAEPAAAASGSSAGEGAPTPGTLTARNALAALAEAVAGRLEADATLQRWQDGALAASLARLKAALNQV
jgi:hypothetical protein